jgi:acyl carrier protein
LEGIVIVTAEQVRDAVVEILTEPLGDLGYTPGTVPDDLDLLTTGAIDSFGILELIIEVNERFGLDLEFEELDAEDLTIIGPFCRHVARMSAAGRTAA